MIGGALRRTDGRKGCARLVQGWLCALVLGLALPAGLTAPALAQDTAPPSAQDTAPPPAQDQGTGTAAPQDAAAGQEGALAPDPARPTGPVNGTRGNTFGGEMKTAATEVDYTAWERMAERAEAEVADPNVTDLRLDLLRAQLVDWRAAFQTAQSANSSRIATLRAQIAALGPPPEEGATEAPEIAERRQALADQLVEIQAPGIAAVEAYRRADGLIREIDRVVRDRQADQLMQLWPAPLNPANWPEAAIGLSDTLIRLWDEGVEAATSRKSLEELWDNLPVVLLLLVLAAGLLTQGRKRTEAFVLRLQGRSATVRGRQVWALAASTGMVILPALGLTALATALSQSGLAGEIGTQIVAALVPAGLPVIVAAWLGSRVFPQVALPDDILTLPPERRAEGRLHAVLLGLFVGIETLRAAAMDAQSYSEATTAVMKFPVLLAAGLVLWRVGRLLRLPARIATRAASADEAAQGPTYAQRLISLVGRGLGVIGIAGPALAAFGYVPAASAVIYPAIASLGLIALLFILQRLVGDLWALVTRNEAAGRDALVPVLAGFALSILALPALALIWGARPSDLTELWTRFTEGFQLGETRISPTDFLIFAAVFVAGYMLTRLLQGALRTTILPKTSLDQGGQTAAVAGIGYVGIFLSALIAINAAGIDLSGLAIVAGALSVGIGFGLQNIVSNFISGIILLIERPVSEGDWIEVGGVQGRVRAISVRSTRIETFDRNDVIVPNADLITGQVTNWTRFNLSGRLIVPVGVAFGSDTRKVERVLREIAEAQPLAILNPPPLVALMGFSADAMNFEIRMILRDVNFSLSVRSEINHQIVTRFAEEGIEIPFAQSEVTLRNAGELGRAIRGIVEPPGDEAPPAPRPAPPGPHPEDMPP